MCIVPASTAGDSKQCWDTLIKHVCQQQQTPKNSLFVLSFFIYLNKNFGTDFSGVMEKFCNKCKHTEDMKSFLLCWMPCGWSYLWERKELKTTTKIYWQLSHDCNPMWHISEIRFLETLFFHFTWRKIKCFFW